MRCANTGLSVHIDSAGRLVGNVGEGRYGDGRRAGWLKALVASDDRTTLYGRVGESMAWLCAIASGLLLMGSYMERRKGP